MVAKWFAASIVVLVLAIMVRPVAAQNAPASSPPAAPAAGQAQPSGVQQVSGTSPTWRAPGQIPRDSAGSSEPIKPLTPLTPHGPIAHVTKGPGTLPNDAGQEWKDYDISPYTLRVTSTNKPEQAIVDWILLDTGYETWHSEPLGLLSANQRTLSVYHTPKVQAVVGEMVDRFVNSEAESHAFGLRVLTVGSPNWRSKAHHVLHPVPAQSQGVQAWLLAKEDASLLLADLRRRSDFREHSTPHLLVNNGQSTTVSATQTKNYTKDAIVHSGASWPGFEPQTAQIEEGFSLEFHPLLAIDGKTIDAIVKCQVDQVEKMIPVMVDVPTAVAPRQRTEIKVPQLASCKLHERYRWPVDQVLLISLGVVSFPIPSSSGSALPLGLSGGAARADLLVLVESKGKVTASPTDLRSVKREASSYHGRYQ
jgi:hypothetical protein